MSLLYSQKGVSGLADQWLDRGLQALGRQDATYRIYEELLSGEQPITSESLDRLLVLPQEKAILLSVLAMRYPEHKGWLLAEASRFNYDLGFPHSFLESLGG